MPFCFAMTFSGSWHFTRLYCLNLKTPFTGKSTLWSHPRRQPNYSALSIFNGKTDYSFAAFFQHFHFFLHFLQSSVVSHVPYRQFFVHWCAFSSLATIFSHGRPIDSILSVYHDCNSSSVWARIGYNSSSIRGAFERLTEIVRYSFFS